MYLNNNSIEYQNFQDFEKYARFISNKFDINIQLEAAKAETDTPKISKIVETVFFTDKRLSSDSRLSSSFALVDCSD